LVEHKDQSQLTSNSARRQATDSPATATKHVTRL